MDPIVMTQRLWETILDITRIPHSRLEMLMSSPDPTFRRLALGEFLVSPEKAKHEADG